MENFTIKFEQFLNKTASALITLGVSLLIITITQVSVHAQHLDVTIFPSDNWVKESGIRINFDSIDIAAPRGLHTPYVYRFPDGTLRIYYDQLRQNFKEMHSATSTDGLVWVKDTGDRLPGFGFHPHIIKVSDTLFRMYYEASLTGAIKSALSSDGLTWVVEAGFRLISVPGSHTNLVVDPVVIELPGGLLRMYYRVRNENFIGSATSTNGLTWSVESGRRIENAAEFAAIRLPDSTVVIYFSRPNYSKILSARSSDGLSFTDDPGVRLLPGNHPDGFLLESGTILTTSIVQFPGDTLRMYYQGSSSSTDVNFFSRVFSAVAVPKVEEVVNLDIKPTSCPNPLNVKSNGVLPIAILGTADFDVNDIDVSSVLLQGISPIRSNIEDVSTPVVNKVDVCDCTTGGADGFDDLTLKFKTQDIVSTLGPVSGGDTIVLTITGILLDSTPFDASDCIIITPVGGGNDTAGAKVAICHIPPGNPANSHTIFVSSNAVDAHLAHGDNLGACDSIAFGGNNDPQLRLSAYPNPFSETTIIQFDLDETVYATLRVFNIMGKHIITLFEGTMEENNLYSIQFNAEDLPTGIYYYKLETENGIIRIEKLLLK
ncbi:MAG: T9SS type A sorting domain-containing protein [Cytophagales bacterium]|nr:T9SS type A sorting domain-containing protein [Cytophagales bacterium]